MSTFDVAMMNCRPNGAVAGIKGSKLWPAIRTLSQLLKHLAGFHILTLFHSPIMNN